MTKLTISKLGQATGLTPKTIRYYEEIALIEPSKRAENGYRLYDPDSIEELILIREARDLGLPIKEIKKLMKGCVDKSCEHSRNDVLADLKQYLALVQEKIDQFNLLKKSLSGLQTTIKSGNCGHEDRYCCNLLYQLVHPEGR